MFVRQTRHRAAAPIAASMSLLCAWLLLHPLGVRALSADSSWTLSLISSDGDYNGRSLVSSSAGSTQTVIVDSGVSLPPNGASQTYYKSPPGYHPATQQHSGALGEALAGNFPGTLVAAYSWMGVDGSLYAYGGQNAPAKLWRYERASGMWRWLLGFSNNASPVYGTRRQAAATSHPGGRFGGSSVADAQGNLWLLGGSGRGDLWMLNVTSLQWTWMAGSNLDQGPAFSFAKGVEFDAADGGGVARAAWGSRPYGAMFFSALDNCISIFAGDAGGPRNDMWRYNPATDKITWVHGSAEVDHGSSAVYPASPDGVFAANYLPYPRRDFGYASDSARGLAYILGGRCDNPGRYGYIANDVWVFDSARLQWAWISGTKLGTPYDQSTYGSFRLPTAANVWSGRSRHATAIDPVRGFIYTFGGFSSSDWMSDVSRFEVATGWWAWWGGSKTPNPPANENPPATPSIVPIAFAMMQGLMWCEPSGDLWYGFGTGPVGVNQLWHMEPQAVQTFTFALSPAARATSDPVCSTDLSVRIASAGINVLTLGANLQTSRYTFCIVAEDGSPATPFTLVVVQRAGASNRAWSGNYSVHSVGLDADAVAVSSETMSAGCNTSIALPFTAVGGTASLALTLNSSSATIHMTSASVTDSSLSADLALAVGNNAISFAVTSESGAVGSCVLDFLVPPSPINGWRGSYTIDAGSAVEVNSSTSAPGLQALSLLPGSAAGSVVAMQVTVESAVASLAVSVRGVSVGSLLTPMITLAEGSNVVAFTVTSQSGAAAGPFTFDFRVASTVNSFAGSLLLPTSATTQPLLSSVLANHSEVSYSLPFTSAGHLVLVVLQLGHEFATLDSTVNGVSNSSSGVQQCLQAQLAVGNNTIEFTVTSQSGAVAGPFRFQFQVAPASTTNSWAGSLQLPLTGAAVDISLSSSAVLSDGSRSFSFPFSSAGRLLSLNLTLDASAATVSSTLNGVSIGSLTEFTLAVGNNTLEFTVTSESGAVAGPFTFKFVVAVAATSAGWTGAYTAQGIAVTISSQTIRTGAVQWIPLASSAVGSVASLSLTLDSPFASINVTRGGFTDHSLEPSLTLAEGNNTLAFSVRSESGVLTGPYLFNFLVAPATGAASNSSSSSFPVLIVILVAVVGSVALLLLLLLAACLKQRQARGRLPAAKAHSWADPLAAVAATSPVFASAVELEVIHSSPPLAAPVSPSSATAPSASSAVRIHIDDGFSSRSDDVASHASPAAASLPLASPSVGARSYEFADAVSPVPAAAGAASGGCAN